MKLTILGGGGFRTPYVWQALVRDQGSPRVTEVALYDTDVDRLQVMLTILNQLAAGFAETATLSLHTDLTRALEGADFIFAAIRVGGVEGRRCDEHVALDLGVIGQETTGPGGLAYALRTIPVMLDIAGVVKKVAPNAYFLNFTNPAGIITEAMQSVLGDRVLGICDTPSGLGRRVAGALGYDHESVTMDYVGLNHLGWMRRVLVDGRDVLPDLLGDDAKLDRIEEAQVFGKDWIRTLGAIPNEYLYYWYFNREAVHQIRLSPETRGDFLASTQSAFFTDAQQDPEDSARLWSAAVDERGASYMAEAKGGVQGAPTTPHELETDPSHLGYAGEALGVMAAISRNEKRAMILNVRNRGTVAALPFDAVVEVTALVDANGVRPLALETQPSLEQSGLMQSMKAVERHIIRAAVDGSRREALLAVALHPLVDSVNVAEQILQGYIDGNPDVAAIFERSSS